MTEARYITRRQLVAKRACQGYLRKFSELFPLGYVQVTQENAVKYALNFDWYWAAEELLHSDLWKAWRQDAGVAERAANAKRQRANNDMREANRVAENALSTAREAHLFGARSAYDRGAFTVAEQAYHAAADANWRAFEDASNEADKEYQEIIAVAFAQAYLASPPEDPRKDFVRGLRARYMGELADMAGCYSPDRIDSLGAQFLDMVRDDVAELIEEDSDLDGEALRDKSGEIAGEAVERMEARGTNGHWDAFRDLGAYQEDLSEFGAFKTMEEGLHRAMWQIADRLAYKLADEFQEVLDTTPGEATEPVDVQPYADQETEVR